MRRSLNPLRHSRKGELFGVQNLMTMFFPSPVAGTAFPVLPPPPGVPAAIGLPPNITILAAMALGLLPAQTRVGGFGVGGQNPTVASLISNGSINPSALASTLAFASPTANYGGN
jgi:hypothetical protein